MMTQLEFRCIQRTLSHAPEIFICRYTVYIYTDRDDIKTSSGSHVKESEYVLPYKIKCIDDIECNLKVGLAVRAHARARCPCPPPIRKAERDERERTKSQRAAAAVVCAMFRSS